MKNIRKYLLIIFCLGMTPAFAQHAEMADKLRAEGKIYILVALILIVLFGLISYLFVTDRKLSRLEKTLNKLEQTKTGPKSLS